MKTKTWGIKALMFGLLAATLSACSYEDNYYTVKTDGVKDTTIQIHVGYKMAGAKAGTRAAETDNSSIVEPTILPGNIGVWYTPATLGSYAWTDFFSSMYTYAPTETAGQLTLVGTDIPYYPATADGKIKAAAWYPADAGGVTGFGSPTGTFTVKTDQTKAADYAASDLMFGASMSGVDTEISPSTTAIPLYFTHKLSKITVKLVAGTGINKDMLEKPTIVMNNVSTSTPIDVVKQTVGEAEDASGTDNVTVSTGLTDSGNIYSAIIPQQSIGTANPFITITLASGKVYNYTPQSAINFSSGNHYTFTFTLSGNNGITVSYTIEPWTDGGNTDIDL